MNERIKNAALRAKLMSADDAAQFVNHGDKVGMSGFTGSAYPKALPTAIAERARAEHEAGRDYTIDLFTGASTAPDCDGVLAEADALRFRAPYQSDPTMRAAINAGRMGYADMHLSHSAQQVEEGFFGGSTSPSSRPARSTPTATWCPPRASATTSSTSTPPAGSSSR